MRNGRPSEPEPAPYPNTQTAEARAVSILNVQVNPALVKNAINVGDNTPNTDGSIEIVNERGIPVGKFEVQIKAIRNGKTSYSCPTALVAYSNVCFSPFLLICVDIDTNQCYWKQIHQGMPEYKPSQQTFTIHFDPATDLISSSEQYIQLWRVILEEHKTLFRGAQVLKDDILRELSLAGLPGHAINAFQQYVDTINVGLDSEFKVIKSLLFPNVWKFGVAIHGYDDKQVVFREYAVERGTNGPLLIRVPENMDLTVEGNTAHGLGLTSEFSMDLAKDGLALKRLDTEKLYSPALLGKHFLYKFYRFALHERLFHLGGTFLCIETIFAFFDHFRIALGFRPSDVLSLEEVKYAVTTYLPAWYQLALKKIGITFDANSGMQIPTLDGLFIQSFEAISQVSSDEVLKLISEGGVQTYTCLYFSNFYMRQAIQAVDTLKGRGLLTIERPYARCSNSSSPLGGSVDDAAALEHNLKKIIDNLFSEYQAFALSNGLTSLLQGRYLDPSRAFAYYLDFDAWFREAGRPKLYECVLSDSNRSHRKGELYLGQCQGVNSTEGLSVSIAGKVYRTRSQGVKDVRFLLSERPLQEWILDDLLRLDGEIFNPSYGHLEQLLSQPKHTGRSD